MAITFRGAGAIAGADNASVTPALFESPTAGDLLLCHGLFRGLNGTLGTPTNWNLITGHPLDATGHRSYLFWKVAVGADSNPTVTTAGGSSGSPVAAICTAFRGTHATAPIGDIGTGFISSTTTQNIGPITDVVTTQADGAVIVFAAKNDDWTSVATLSGDGLTWGEAYDTFYNPLTNDCALVMDYSIWAGAAPTLTDKTFVVTGGTPSKNTGQMVVLVPSASAAGQPFRKRWGGVPFAAGGRIGVW